MDRKTEWDELAESELKKLEFYKKDGLQSQFMQHVHLPAYYVDSLVTGSRNDLADYVRAYAVQANPEIGPMTDHLRDLISSYQRNTKTLKFTNTFRRHDSEIKALEDKIVRGEVPMPDWNSILTNDVEAIAGFRATIRRQTSALDSAYSEFEKKFFIRPEGRTLASYIEAAKDSDFTEFRKECPANGFRHDYYCIVPEDMKPVDSVEAAPAKSIDEPFIEDIPKSAAVEETVVAEAETFLAKLGRHKIKAGLGAAAVVAAGSWVLAHANKAKEAEKKPAERGV